MYIFKPVSVSTVFSMLFQILKGEELSADMIENSVHYNLYTDFMAGLYKVYKVIIVSEP